MTARVEDGRRSVTARVERAQQGHGGTIPLVNVLNRTLPSQPLWNPCYSHEWLIARPWTHVLANCPALPGIARHWGVVGAGRTPVSSNTVNMYDVDLDLALYSLLSCHGCH